MYNFSQFDSVFHLILTLSKCTSFAVFLKDYCCFRQKIKFIGDQFQNDAKKLTHLRFWSDGVDFRTETQKFFHARAMHTT